ncbi:exonuclease 3'-5' domain-containing protein 2-like isoform X2 [Dendronephthya gigantea]|uniref:exonuclease 3'-5' domain-containing protein 2-like isoform X2 n=1 Tax=Dendronephthya gigantea TaxID=151771 RepID=UPI001069EF4C|nr:exonuclease 3'-5' domain-containing protein 2-like isoform X2 [Dendronephthya gigantea]
MVDNKKFSSGIIVFDDINACNARLCEEIDNYLYEIIVFGLDCEWVTASQEQNDKSSVSPVALLQIAFPNGTCFLIRLCKMGAKLSDKLKEILEDRNILKTGVGISEDVKKLNACYGLVIQGCVDLRHVALRCHGYVEYRVADGGIRQGMSLSALSQQILGVTMDKDWRIRCSNWEAPQLSERQIEYAANDAIIAIQIFFKLAASKLKERKYRVEAGEKEKDESINLETDDVSLRKEECPLNSHDLSGDVQESSKKIDENSSKGVSCNRDPTGTDSVVSLNSISTESTSQGNITQSDRSADESDPQSDKIDPENTTSVSHEKGMISNLVSKIQTFSLGSFLGMQAEASQVQKVHNSKKTKNYTQYQSFKGLELNTHLFSSHELWSSITPLCHGITDVPYKMKTKNKQGTKVHESSAKSQKNLTGQTSNKVSGLKPRRLPLYQNCVIEAPDGEMLSTCDKRKAEWYLCRNLAEVVKEEPYTIRLNFEPSGRPFDPEHKYYLTFKENMCVVCGRDDSYMRKNIIPHDYRKHFPVCMKDHHSHDVLLLCPSDHMISTYQDDLLRRKLAEKYQAPLASAQVARLMQDPELKNVKSAAKALVYAGEKIPEGRRNELLATVKEYFKTDEPTREMLLKASELETRRENCDFISHGREVVRKVKEEGELLAFERMWREHFLETMNPKYLPPLWTVDHEQEKVKKLLEKELGNFN